uniref:Uncharacterized protein n=1 Tax=Rhodopseudomonas palustris (strain BisA53) TaxID=316055 RepID=Q07P71_RHOP5
MLIGFHDRQLEQVLDMVEAQRLCESDGFSQTVEQKLKIAFAVHGAKLHCSKVGPLDERHARPPGGEPMRVNESGEKPRITSFATERPVS